LGLPKVPIVRARHEILQADFFIAVAVIAKIIFGYRVQIPTTDLIATRRRCWFS
jgi:hypothetical protein